MTTIFPPSYPRDRAVTMPWPCRDHVSALAVTAPAACGSRGHAGPPSTLLPRPAACLLRRCLWLQGRVGRCSLWVSGTMTGPRAARGPISRPQQAAPGAGWSYPWRHRRGHAQICQLWAQISSVCVSIPYKYANRCGFNHAKRNMQKYANLLIHTQICKMCTPTLLMSWTEVKIIIILLPIIMMMIIIIIRRRSNNLSLNNDNDNDKYI